MHLKELVPAPSSAMVPPDGSLYWNQGLTVHLHTGRGWGPSGGSGIPRVAAQAYQGLSAVT